ncbi:hypothetical protein [Haladaptatus halobius]|uniref:hypothetical protein n=1 Tax=Haladaptatus halobius TaxID=2884875 RepID=UPI001D0AABDB|nr:hypothetical protein [Haladaptatus halobius]
MSIEINRTAIENRMERPQGEYGEVPVEDQTWERPSETFTEVLGYARDGYLGGAYA